MNAGRPCRPTAPRRGLEYYIPGRDRAPGQWRRRRCRRRPRRQWLSGRVRTYRVQIRGCPGHFFAQKAPMHPEGPKTPCIWGLTPPKVTPTPLSAGGARRPGRHQAGSGLGRAISGRHRDGTCWLRRPSGRQRAGRPRRAPAAHAPGAGRHGAATGPARARDRVARAGHRLALGWHGAGSKPEPSGDVAKDGLRPMEMPDRAK